MESIQNIIIDNSLDRVNDELFSNYICHAYCYNGASELKYNNRTFRFEKGNCMIIVRIGDLFNVLSQSNDFEVDAIFVSQKFLELSTPQSNYGMKGHLSLFQNPIIPLSEAQQDVCKNNFSAIKKRLKQTEHLFRHDALRNAIECMIIDFFDFHASLYPSDKVSSQQFQIMEQFLDLLEQGDFRKNRELGYYADKLCVTTKYLSEVAKKVSGLPAAYWITRYTSLDISRQLRNKNLSVSDVSDMFGFSSLSHFSKYVQANLGVKPTDLRE